MHWVHCIMAKLAGFWIVVSRINASLSVMSNYFPFIVGIILFMSRNSWYSKIKGAKSKNYLTYKAIVLQRTQQSMLQETLLLQSWNSCSEAYLQIFANSKRASASGQKESLGLYSIPRSDWSTSKQEVLQHRNQLVAQVGRLFRCREATTANKFALTGELTRGSIGVYGLELKEGKFRPLF